MRFIGGKSLMLNRIDEVMRECTNGDVAVAADLFSGSGVVSQSLKRAGMYVVSNDVMYMSYVLARGMTELNETPEFCGLDKIDVFGYLNKLIEPMSANDAFIYNNYSPNANCERMYFQPDNAKKIDAVRQQIEIWWKHGKLLEQEYFYLLACLISAVPYIANIAGVYAAYLKKWDVRTYKRLDIVPLEIIRSDSKCESFNMDAIQLCKDKVFDLAYIDTPYNKREYMPNYHVLETIARYDSPAIRGVTGMRDYSKSAFCSNSTVRGAFRNLFINLRAKYAIVSYNTEGLLSTQELIGLFSEFGNVRLFEYPARRYKSKIHDESNGLKEQLYFVDLRGRA